MGYKYNDKTGYWEAFYSKRHPITRLPVSARRTQCKTEAEARRMEKVLIVQVEQKLHKEVIPTWSKLSEDCFESFRDRGLTEKTIESYSLCIRAHTYADWAERTVDTITTQEVRQLIQAKVGHRSPSHQKNLLKFIRSVFNFGVESGVIQRNPTPNMKFQIGEKIKKVLTKEQIRHFLNRAKLLDWEWYPHCALALYTGMRNGELYALTWDKVNFESDQLIVDSSWNNVDGFKSTKSGDDRIVDLAPNAVRVLKELKVKSFDSNFVLPRIDKWDKGEQARELRLFLTGIGLPPVRFHDLRASWATHMLSLGVEPIKVMNMGGWKDLKTMQIYIRKAGVNVKGAAQGLDLHDPSIEDAKVLDFGNRSSR